MSFVKIPGIITVRTSSNRLPQKCLLPFGEINIIEHIIKRAKFYNIEPIICTSSDQSDDIIELIAINQGVKYFRGSLNNKLKRWFDCAKFFNLEYFHTVDADDPFFDGELMHLSISKLLELNCDIVNPTQSSSAGAASVGYSLKTSIIEKALIGTSDKTDTEMMWFYIDKVKGVNKYTLEEPEELSKLNLRLTLDYQEDYWLLSSIQRILGNLATRDEILNLFNNNPDFTLINWFRNIEWKNAQDSKKI
jgi:spore coat polysaccharide biosynthesis protein SpsF